jgi:hypothetical protein
MCIHKYGWDIPTGCFYYWLITLCWWTCLRALECEYEKCVQKKIWIFIAYNTFMPIYQNNSLKDRKISVWWDCMENKFSSVFLKCDKSLKKNFNIFSLACFLHFVRRDRFMVL